MRDDEENKAMAGIAMQMATLVLRSEERMDRTNRMIAAMANHEGWIEEKYIQHIDSLERRLSEVMEENDRLLRIVAEMRGEYERLLSMYDRLAHARQARTDLNING